MKGKREGQGRDTKMREHEKAADGDCRSQGQAELIAEYDGAGS